MQNQQGFIGVGILIAIILATVVLGGGAYYVVKQQVPLQTRSETTSSQTQTKITTNAPTTPTQNLVMQGSADSKSPTKIAFSFPTEASILPVGKSYSVTWSGQNSSDQTPVTLYASNPMCANVGLVPEGERGCSAEKLGNVTLGSGTYQLKLEIDSTLVPLNKDHRAPVVLFFDTPQGRVTSKAFIIISPDFSVGARIEKTLYSPGETIRFYVGGTADTGELLTPESGFAASSWLEFDIKNNLDAQGSKKTIDGVFDPVNKQWNFVATAPLVRRTGYDYRIWVYLKCQDQSICKQRYSWPLEKDAVLKFNVSQN